MRREPNTVYVLSLSYGKDSVACIEACRQLGYPLDRIVHAEVWATDTISADLPPMVEFKAKADAIIKERYGIEVEHVCAMKDGEKMTYERTFYSRVRHRPETVAKISGGGGYKHLVCPKIINGFPIVRGQWCNTILKRQPLARISRDCRSVVSESAQGEGIVRDTERFTDSRARRAGGARNSSGGQTKFSAKGGTDPKINVVQYLGIAADEPERIKRHTKPGIVLPLVDIGWDEAFCREWCEENDLLSPIYTTAARGGCWFCHNQGVEQLRSLRRNYPDLWKLLLKWDDDSPTTFKPDGHTVHDYDRRFEYEDRGIIDPSARFKWAAVMPETNGQIHFDFLERR